MRDCRPLGPDTALLTVVAGMVPPESDRINPQTNAAQSVVASRSGGAWRIDLFQNTPTAYFGRDEDRERLTAELQATADAGER